MSDFRTVPGFEDVWRPPVRPKRVRPDTVLGPAAAVRSRLQRLVARTPEVMVKVTGRTRDGGHLAAHLHYITRHGGLAAEDRESLDVVGRQEVQELAEDWTAAARWDSRRRVNSPMSLSLVLSMPAQTDPLGLRDAARAFARETFAERFDYVMVLHTDTGHPHVHLSVRALGDDGARLNPRKADLEAWRQGFARCLRERGIAAEATPRRARGVTRKAERTPLRKLRERHERGEAPAGRVRRGAYQDAAKAAFGEGPRETPPWEARILERQARVRRVYLAQAKLLQASAAAEDQALGRAVEAFVRGMPAPDTQRLALARALRDANRVHEAKGPSHVVDKRRER